MPLCALWRLYSQSCLCCRPYCEQNRQTRFWVGQAGLLYAVTGVYASSLAARPLPFVFVFYVDSRASQAFVQPAYFLGEGR